MTNNFVYKLKDELTKLSNWPKTSYICNNVHKNDHFSEEHIVAIVQLQHGKVQWST